MFFKPRSDCCNPKSLYYFSCWQQIRCFFVKESTFLMNFVQHQIPTQAMLKFPKGASEKPSERQMSPLAPKPIWRNEQIMDKIQTKEVITDLELNVQTGFEKLDEVLVFTKLLTWLICQVRCFFCDHNSAQTWKTAWSTVEGWKGQLHSSCSLIWVTVS